MMKASSHDSRQFTLQDDATNIGTLVYPKWYSLTADIEIGGLPKYKVGPKDIWGTTMELKEGDAVLVKLKINWKGNAVVHLLPTEQKFELQQRGLLKSSFVLTDSEGNELMFLKPNFQWTKLNYDYQIETTDIFKKMKQQHLLVFASIHYINYYISMTTAAMA